MTLFLYLRRAIPFTLTRFPKNQNLADPSRWQDGLGGTIIISNSLVKCYSSFSYSHRPASQLSSPRTCDQGYHPGRVDMIKTFGEHSEAVQHICPYTVWAASVPVGGGRQLNPGQIWNVNVPGGITQARIWARTECTFDGSGRGGCKTGDCNGLLNCQSYGARPNTLAEFSLNQPYNLDYIDISLVDGFNVPMEFSSPSKGCTRNPILCKADINGQCPSQLRLNGGCNNPCCGPSDTSRFFKQRCPDAYSYPSDDPTSLFTCPGGANYKVVFCP